MLRFQKVNHSSALVTIVQHHGFVQVFEEIYGTKLNSQ